MSDQISPLKLVIVGGPGRTGGTMLVRLLDGNPKLACHHAYYTLLTREGGRPDYYHWPRLKKLRNRSNWISLWFNLPKQMISIHPITGKIVRGGMQDFDAGITEKEFMDFLKGRLAEYGLYIDLRTFLDVLNSCLAEKFCTHYKNVEYLVGHWADGWLLDSDRYFDTYPDGFFIHTMRDLRSTLASRKVHAEKFGRLFNISNIIKHWLIGLDVAIKKYNRYSGRYIIVLHNRMILNTKSEMELICNTLGVKVHENCDRPTYRNKPWGDQMSAYKNKKNKDGNIDWNHLDAWKKILSKDEKELCDKYYRYFEPVFEAADSKEAVSRLNVLTKANLSSSNLVIGNYKWLDYYKGKPIRPFEIDSLISRQPSPLSLPSLKDQVKMSIARIFVT